MAGYNDSEGPYTSGATGFFTHLSHITDITNKFDKDATPSSGNVLTWNGSVYVPQAPSGGGGGGDIEVFNVKDYGAVGNDVIGGTPGTDCTTAFANCAAALVTAGKGIFYIPPGTYRVTALPSFVPVVSTGPLTYAIQGAGSHVSKIHHVGTTFGSSLTVSNPSFNPGHGLASTGSPLWSGFTIDGTGSSGGCSGLRWGDISYPSFIDVEITNFSTGDGFFFSNGYGWCEGVNMLQCKSLFNLNQIRFDVGSGRQLGTITTTLTNGVAYTSIAVSGGISEALSSGQSIVIAAAPSVSVSPNGTGGVFTQTVTTSGAVSAGATSIPVNSFTAGANYPSGTARIHFGGYGSYDYWTIASLFIQGNADQHGWVSEVSRGIGQKMDRIGSLIRCTGNFRAGGTNSGKLFWIKGEDTYSDTMWDFTCETGGSGVYHKGLQIDSNNGAIGGHGIWSAYGFETATFGGGTYQWNFSGLANLKGITDASSAITFRQMREPGFINVSGSVEPTRGGTAASPVAGQYPNSTTTGTAWQNTTGADVLVHVTFAFTGSGTASFNTNVWDGLPAGSTMIAGPSGQTHTLSFLHYHLMWARVDWTNATVTITSVRYAS